MTFSDLLVFLVLQYFIAAHVAIISLLVHYQKRCGQLQDEWEKSNLLLLLRLSTITVDNYENVFIFRRFGYVLWSSIALGIAISLSILILLRSLQNIVFWGSNTSWYILACLILLSITINWRAALLGRRYCRKMKAEI